MEDQKVIKLLYKLYDKKYKEFYKECHDQDYDRHNPYTDRYAFNEDYVLKCQMKTWFINQLMYVVLYKKDEEIVESIVKDYGRIYPYETLNIGGDWYLYEMKDMIDKLKKDGKFSNLRFAKVILNEMKQDIEEPEWDILRFGWSM